MGGTIASRPTASATCRRAITALRARSYGSSAAGPILASAPSICSAGAKSKLVQGEAETASDQRQGRNSRKAANVPGGIRAPTLHSADRRLLRMACDQGCEGKAALRDCDEGPLAVRPRRSLGELEGAGH